MKYLFIFVSCYVFCVPIYSVEYLYPVAQDKQTLYVMHQTAPGNIELWCYNTLTGYSSQALLPHFVPANVQLLPDEKGFSFIDNDIIRLKEFCKRSPRSLEPNMPIYNFTVMHWIDGTRCYASAQYGKHVGIFEIDTHGITTPLIISEDADCSYPYKVGNQLFYIEKGSYNIQQHYEIKCCSYPEKEVEKNQSFKSMLHLQNKQQSRAIKRHSVSHTVYDFAQKPITFLHMINDVCGYVIEHQKKVSKASSCINFTYHRIYKTVAGWESRALFNFKIPTYLLFFDTEYRLYESILPLLPHHNGIQIYFTSTKNGGSSDIYSFNVETEKITKITHAAANEYFFSPRFASSLGLVYGGLVNNTGLDLYFDDDEQTKIVLPTVQNVVSLP